MDELEFYNGQLTGQEIDARVLRVYVGQLSGTSVTVENANIMEKHYVIGASFNPPEGAGGTFTVTTADGSVTVSGSPYGTVTLTLFLGLPLY